MAFNTTQKDMPTGKRVSKGLTPLWAAHALKGHTVHRTDPVGGDLTYCDERWGLVRFLPTLHDAAHFLLQIGGRL